MTSTGNHKENLLESLKNRPEFLRSTDLIELGLFTSRANVCRANKIGCAPPMIRLGDRKIIYPKKLLIEWLLERLQKSPLKELVD